MDYFPFKRWIYALFPNIKAMNPPRVNMKKKDFSVLAEKKVKKKVKKVPWQRSFKLPF